MKSFFKKIWSGWKKFAHKFGVFQTKLILTILYFVIIAIAGIIAALLRSDLLDRRYKNRPSEWTLRDEPVPDLESCKRQF